MTTEKFVVEICTETNDHFFLGAGYCQSAALSLMHSLAQFLDPRQVSEVLLIDMVRNSVIDMICYEGLNK